VAAAPHRRTVALDQPRGHVEVGARERAHVPHLAVKREVHLEKNAECALTRAMLPAESLRSTRGL
jgi:hypothetical protein